MIPERVSLPERLLVDTSLSKSAKLLWAFRRLGLGRRPSGLCRDTYRASVAQLRAGGWLTHVRCGSGDPPFFAESSLSILQNGGSWASIPSDLLLDRRVGTQARLLYGLLQFTPGFSHDSGQFTFTKLCERAGVSRNTLKEGIKRLVDLGWLAVSRTSKFASIHFKLNRSPYGVREQEVARVVREYKEAPSKAEGLMQALLSVIVASRDFVRRVRPGFLINPETGHELELDRYYPPHLGPSGALVGGVALEFQGLQHDQTTARFPDPAQLRAQQRRDRRKAETCAQRGIQLVLVREGDLSLNGMRRKVAGLLPPRDLDENRQLVKVVEGLCSEYRASAKLGLPTPHRASP